MGGAEPRGGSTGSRASLWVRRGGRRPPPRPSPANRGKLRGGGSGEGRGRENFSALRCILDNSSVHKAPAVKEWLAKNPKVHFHFTPTSSSCLNLIERFFGELTQRQIRRLAVTRLDQLVAAITAYIENRNCKPNPSVWTASVQQILDKGRQSEAEFGHTTLAPVTDEPALAAINLLVNGSPEREREKLRARLLDLLREAYGASAQEPPEWLK
jgi:transposase